MNKEEFLKDFFWKLRELKDYAYDEEVVERILWEAYSQGYEDGLDDG